VNESRHHAGAVPPGLLAGLAFSDADPVMTCECGHRSHGDSVNDAVLAWTRHVTSTPECREKL